MKILANQDTAESPPQSVKTFKDAIYNHLRNAIINHKIKPQERIQEKTIAREFGISTTPVREAILKLEGEGFLTIDAHRRVTVKPLSIIELSEIYEVIGVLDGFATRLALQNSKAAFLEEVNRLTSNMERVYRRGEILDYLNLNTEIHSIIWKASGNSFLIEKLHNTVARMRTFNIERLSLYSTAGIMDKSLESHFKLLRVFRNRRQWPGVEQICRRHWAIYAEYLRKQHESTKEG
jgi:DNA-binding GntR family transcriptional regulator